MYIARCQRDARPRKKKAALQPNRGRELQKSDLLPETSVDYGRHDESKTPPIAEKVHPLVEAQKEKAVGSGFLFASPKKAPGATANTNLSWCDLSKKVEGKEMKKNSGRANLPKTREKA